MRNIGEYCIYYSQKKQIIIISFIIIIIIEWGKTRLDALRLFAEFSNYSLQVVLKHLQADK